MVRFNWQSSELICNVCDSPHVEITPDGGDGWDIQFWFYCNYEDGGVEGDYHTDTYPSGRELDDLRYIMEAAYV